MWYDDMMIDDNDDLRDRDSLLWPISIDEIYMSSSTSLID